LAVGEGALGRPIGERCGSCRACLDACPTDAFEAPYVLDPRRCLSYLTIERRSLDGPFFEAGDHLFGCDDCQEACPYNRVPSPPGQTPFDPLPGWSAATLEELVTADDETFDRLTRGSPLRRAHRRGLARNALHVAASRVRRGLDDDDARRALAAGRAHPDPDLAALARSLSPNPVAGA